MMRLSDSDLATLMPSLKHLGSDVEVDPYNRSSDIGDRLQPSHPALSKSTPSQTPATTPASDPSFIPHDHSSRGHLSSPLLTEADASGTAEEVSPRASTIQPLKEPTELAPSEPSDLLNPPVTAEPSGISPSKTIPDSSDLPPAGTASSSGDGAGKSAVAPETSGFLPVLKNRNFLSLWSGQVFSQLADKVYLVLMIALIASRFQAADQTISGWVSSIMIAFTIPAVLFGSIAGVFVDRWPKKTVLVITNLLRGGLVLALPSLLWISKGWAPLAGLPLGFCMLLGATFLVSTLTQFFAPAEQAAIPLIVERRHLLSANSLYTTTMMASVIVGFAVGEPLLAIADTVINRASGGLDIGKEIAVGGSYAIAGLILLLLKTGEKTKRKEGAPETSTTSAHIFQDIREGLNYLGKQGRVRSALVQLVLLFSVFAALSVLAVRLAEVLPEIKSSQFGFLLAAGGVGMACGAAILGQFGQRFSHSQLNLYGSAGMAASLAGLAIFTHHLWFTLLFITLVGSFGALIGIPMQTTIQEDTPEEMRGIVFGLQNNAINIALTLPLALAGVAETFLGLKAVFLGLAMLMIAGGSFTWYSSRTGSIKTNS